MVKRKLSFKIVIPAFIFLIALMFPFSYIHEIGHASICVGEGYSFDITVGLDGGQIVCHGDVKNQTLYKMMGGAFAMSVALLPFAFYNKIKKYSFIVIAFGVLAIGHGINAVIETMVFDSYMGNTQTWAMIFGLINFLIFLALCMKFSKRSLMFRNAS